MARHFLSLLSFLLLWGMSPITARAGEDAGSRLQEICNQDRFSKACLTALLVYRCSAYDKALHRMGSCFDRARDAAALMDIRSTTEDGQVEVVAFPVELVYLLKQPFTHVYLVRTRDALSEAMRHRSRFDLWRHTVALTGDTRKALWYIGVLLQDTSISAVPLYYLEELGDAGISPETLDVYEEVLGLLEPEQLKREEYSTWLRLYPPMKPAGSEDRFNPTLYHFYTIAYLALRMKWLSGDVRLSAFLPFLIDVSYKFMDIDGDRWPREPRAFDPRTYASQLTDMHAAYLGTLWATGHAGEPLDYAAFSQSLAADPFGFMRQRYLGR